MRKIYALILAAVIILAIPTVAFATSGKLDIDLSKLSYDELVELKDQINLAIWQSEEWEEVEVPQGVWEVGKDIPEGKWTIKASDGNDCFVYVGPKTKNGGADVDWKVHSRIVSEKSPYYDASKYVCEWIIELKNGQFVEIDSASAVFTTYAGKPSLGFKK